MSNETLLPHNASDFELSLEGATSRISDVPVPIRDVWNVADCPLNLLPWLASSFQVNQWNTDWPEDVKRLVISESVDLHRRKGTPSAIRDFFASIGFGDIEINEGRSGKKYDGSNRHDGFLTYGGIGSWAEYRIRFKKLLSNAQADQARVVLSIIAPARCRLFSLDFVGATLIHNAAAKYDGSFSYGVA